MYDIERYQDCTKCKLHQTRHKVVQLKGELPCDVLYIGEAPGPAEDAFGIPFVGPSGDYLNRILQLVHEAFPNTSCSITNIVCCIPKDDEGNFRPPSDEEVHACKDRLAELIRSAHPSLIVCVGQIAERYISELQDTKNIELCSIVHPSAILRSPVETHAWKQHQSAAAIITALDMIDPFQS